MRLIIYPLFYLSDRRKLDAQLKEEEEKRRQVLLQMNSVSEAIQNYEKETSTFLKECQKLYKQEISEVK